GDPGGEVDQPVAVDVLDDRPGRPGRDDRVGVEHARRDRRGAGLEPLARPRPRDLGADLALLRDVHGSSSAPRSAGASAAARRGLRHRFPYRLAFPGPFAFVTDPRSRPGGLRPAGFGILWPGTTLRPLGVPAQEGEVRMRDAKTYKMYIGGEGGDATGGQARKI